MFSYLVLLIFLKNKKKIELANKSILRKYIFYSTYLINVKINFITFHSFNYGHSYTEKTTKFNVFVILYALIGLG